MIRLGRLLSQFEDSSINKDKLLEGLGIEQVGKSIYLIYRSSDDDNSVIRLAKSIDGFEFSLVKIIRDNYKKEKIPEKINEVITIRPEMFDNNEIEIEGVIKLSGHDLVFYHNKDKWGEFQVGAAQISKDKSKKVVWRSDKPLWESSSAWIKKKIEFVGLCNIKGKIIGYWIIDEKQIFAVVYPSFRVRSEQAKESLYLNLEKIKGNPVIKPNTENAWEAWNTFNPAAIYAGGKVHILYRAQGFDYVSVVGYANSKDGLSIEKRNGKPCYVPREPFEWRSENATKYTTEKFASGGGYGGVEDPRATLIEAEGRIYMTYVAFNGCDPPRVAITSIAVDDFLNQRWMWEKPVLISPPGVVDKGPAVFPEKINGKYVIMHRIFPDILIDFVDNLNFDGKTWLKGQYRIKTRPGMWDGGKIGTGAPPIKTKAGWLLIYYGTPYDYEKTKAYNPYLIGAMLLDLNDPTKVLHRSKLPILKPTEHYENNGFKAGVVFPCGAVVINGKLFVYYGGADSYVCVATADLDEFLDKLTYTEMPELEPATIKRI